MLTTGLEGGNSDVVGAGDRVEHPRRWRCRLGPGEHDLGGRDRGVQPDPPLLEVHGLPARPLVALDRHVGLNPVVGHGQQRHAGLPSLAQNAGDRRQREPVAQHGGPGDVRGDVTVTETEPAGTGAVGGEFLQHGEGVAGAAPALLLADPAAQGVHDRVQVRADMQAEQADVVAGVADDCDLGARRGGLQAAQEAGSADAARENGDAHARSLATRGGMPPATPPKTKPRGGMPPRPPPQKPNPPGGMPPRPPKTKTPRGGVHPRRPPRNRARHPEIPLDFPVITVKRVAIITYSP